MNQSWHMNEKSATHPKATAKQNDAEMIIQQYNNKFL